MKFRGGPRRISIAVEQGAIRVSGATLVYRAGRVACIELELNSKYAVLDGYGYGDACAPYVSLGAGEGTLHTHPAGETTVVKFPRYRGWQVFAVELRGKYTAYICLMKDKQ